LRSLKTPSRSRRFWAWWICGQGNGNCHHKVENFRGIPTQMRLGQQSTQHWLPFLGSLFWASKEWTKTFSKRRTEKVL